MNKSLILKILDNTLYMKKIFFISMLLLSTVLSFAQTAQERKTYKIADIAVTGNTKYSKTTILNFTKLKIGDEITVPGPDISYAIKRLMKSGLFNDVEVFIDKVEGENVYLQLKLQGLSTLKDFKVEGMSKSKVEELTKKIDLKNGEKVSDNLVNSTRTSIESDLRKKGYLNAKANITVSEPDSANKVSMNIYVDKGEKIKINTIDFEGNNEFSDKQLRKKALKKLHQKSINILANKKYSEDKLEEDRVNLVNFYRSKGFRDQKILNDTVVSNEKGGVDVKFQLEEGKRYFIRSIKFVGNVAYKTEFLQEVLSYKEGDPYDAIGFQQKVVGGGKKEDDIMTLYYNNGYVFARATPYETSVENDSIDLEVRITEGEKAYYRNVTWEGNTVTFDRVVARNLPTKPGDLFSKEDLKAGVYRLAGLGYFDPQKIEPQVNPNPEDNTVDVNWKLAEQGASTVQLQGGYGAGRFIGTLGLTLNNFSAQNLFHPKRWHGLFPQGDGQQVSINAQAGSNYQNYSLSFTEPWLFGKTPTALSTSVYHSIYKNSSTGGKVKITGVSLGLNHSLLWPDRYFRLSQSLNLKSYNLDNYSFGSFAFNTGKSNNFNYKLVFGRFSAGPDQIFPQNGSDISLAVTLTPPYSLFKDSDFYKLDDAARQQAINNQFQYPGDVSESVKDEYINSLEDAKKYKWLEYYKVKFKADLYRELGAKFVLRLGTEFGYLGGYNGDLGAPPFERYYMGGTGMYGNNYDGSEQVPLRGYADASTAGGGSEDVTPDGGAVVYNKFLTELRYPISMAQAAKIYAVSFFEAGSLAGDTKDYKPFELKRSAGVGLRVFMQMFGMLGIDFAYGFDSYLGQDQPAGWTTHFIFGQQF